MGPGTGPHLLKLLELLVDVVPVLPEQVAASDKACTWASNALRRALSPACCIRVESGSVDLTVFCAV